MKYIRTSNGIYEIVSVDYNDDIEMNQYFTKNGQHFNEHEILKQSDSIPDLCDRYEQGKNIHDNFGDMKVFANQLKKFNGWTDDIIKIYGCIWIDLPNGAHRLEPVAKLNTITMEMELLYE